MPKSLDKTKGAKRKKTPNNSTANTESDTSLSKPGPKKKKLQKKRAIEGIGMSKQLAAQVQNKQQSRTCRPSKTNAAPRVCGNGKPMPSLAELEAMYATDSDDDGDPPKTAPAEERCVTPEQKPIITDEQNLNSPTTLKLITSKVIDLLSKTIVLDDDVPKPIKPQKRPKKSDIPYIVGCRERKQVPWAPKTKFCVGSEKYGVEDSCSSDDEDCCPKKRRKRGEKMNLSKSIFNAKSDEIAERLKEHENLEIVRNCSPGSNETVTYEFNDGSTNRYFEPLPSTSRDEETIMQNEKRFNESLQCESTSNDSQNYVEVIEVPCETIVINDTLTNRETSLSHEQTLDDDCCILVEPETKRKKNEIDNYIKTGSPQEDIYSSIDLTQTLDSEVYVIGDDDIDDVIAQNKAILGTDLKGNHDELPSVIVVNPDDIKVQSSNNQDTSHTDENIPQTGTISPVNCNDTVNIPSDNIATDQTPRSISNEIFNVVNNFFTQSQASPSTGTQAQEITRSRISSFVSWMSSIAFSGRQNQNNVANTSDVIFVDNTQTQRQNNQNPIPNTETSHLTSINNRILSNSPSHRKRSNNNTQPSPSDRTPQILSNKPHQDSQPSRSLGDCPICMDSLASTTVASTICGHVFCMACIKAAVKANGKKCPTCRKALKGVGYHQLFL
ncbi:probable E3 ubiquitin-protein ligase bre1 [Pectinophora gossypiella]|uniref:probable E3 ubiquitin-protein ligase bre1 n=1 Tax=Pectinophora gossypiella TaxID=13191 RepID=UPI00214E8C6E|nr:probable E3 ubiquitin-protein ligase bre1 [Pectinophora gossypiella]